MTIPLCAVQRSGQIELYFYGELGSPDAERIETHLETCAECREALDDLRTIEAALASRPDVSAPPGGDWSASTARLEEAIAVEPSPSRRGADWPLAQWVAAAALVALVTMSVFFAAHAGQGEAPAGELALTDTLSAGVPEMRPAMASYGEQHFERSKLVLLGLASKDAEQTPSDDWQFERELASRLLPDTRIYRLAAEEQGMSQMASVMRDLEFVLLQTSMTEGRDASELSQIQRAIQKRDLLHKMDLVRVGN